MKLLLAAATRHEIKAVIDYLEQYGEAVAPDTFRYGGQEIHICITGVGLVAATYQLTRKLSSNKYNFALQAGIAGSFDREIDLAQVVLVQSETLGDTGAEDNEEFLDLFQLKLADPNAIPFREGKLECPLSEIPFPYRLLTVNGLTVAASSGSVRSVISRKERYDCQVESMEGAAFHYVCICEQVPFTQIRSISNYVTPRNRDLWKMDEAIHTLNEWLIEFFNRV